MPPKPATLSIPTQHAGSARDVMLNRSRALSEAHRAILDGAVSERRHLGAGEVAVRQGQPVRSSTLLVEGYMTRHVDAVDGRRHLVSVHVPGDFVDLHAYPLGHLDHEVGALTDACVAVIPHTTLERILADHPALVRQLWFLTLLDAAMHRQWIYRASSLSALERVAHFLCEMHARLLAIGRCEPGRFTLPMTQLDIGEVCSLTNVHVSRVLRQLREERLCTMRSTQVEILDLRGLALRGRFDPTYLYLDDTLRNVAIGRTP